MAGKTKGGKNKGKAQGAGQSASAEPEVPATDGAKVVNPENGEVNEPPVTEDGVKNVEKGDGDALEVVQPARKPAEGEATVSLLIH
jgi:protein TIF31